MPLTKGWVPSIGSTTQIPCPAANSVRPLSSPRKASPGNAAAIRARIIRSTATSASLTTSCGPLTLTASSPTRAK